MKWTDKEVEQLKTLPKLTTSELIKLMGRSYDDIRQKAKRCGIILNIQRCDKRAWDASDVNLLKKNCLASMDTLITMFPGRTRPSIYGAMAKYGLKRAPLNLWTKYDDEILQNQYFDGDKIQLQKLIPNHCWAQIVIRANKLGLRRSSIFFRRSDLSILLGDSHETYYWIGMLLADGSFYDNVIKLALKRSDAEHVLCFARYIKAEGNYKTYCNMPQVAAQDKDLTPLICKKFDIKPRKTYNPPSVDTFASMDRELMLSLLIGYIDGDGCIFNLHNRKDFAIRLHVHSSWLEILKYFNNLIGNNKNVPQIRNDGYAASGVSNTEICKMLKRHAFEHNLPIMKRKWDRIDLNYVSRDHTGKMRLIKMKDLRAKNFTINQIAQDIGTGYSTVHKALGRAGIK